MQSSCCDMFLFLRSLHHILILDWWMQCSGTLVFEGAGQDAVVPSHCTLVWLLQCNGVSAWRWDATPVWDCTLPWGGTYRTDQSEWRQVQPSSGHQFFVHSFVIQYCVMIRSLYNISTVYEPPIFFRKFCVVVLIRRLWTRETVIDCVIQTKT